MVTTTEKTNVGRITQIIGPVVDVEFASGKMPQMLLSPVKCSSSWETIRYEPLP
jgi:F0F1-type ATP synthase beta subunit